MGRAGPDVIIARGVAQGASWEPLPGADQSGAKGAPLWSYVTRLPATTQDPRTPMPTRTRLDALPTRLLWVRERVLRASSDDVAVQLARLPDPWRHDTRAKNVTRYERGERTPPIEYLAALSELSGCSLDWLVKGQGGKGGAQDAIRRMRQALDAIEEQYRDDPDDVPPSAFTPVG